MASAVLQGQTFAWITCDPAMIISAALQGMLTDFLRDRPVRVALEIAHGFDEAATLAQRNHPSLLTIVDDGNHIVQVAKVLRQVRSRSPSTVRLVYLTANFEQIAPLALEASAQIAVCELPSLQRILPRIVELAKLKSVGYHPFTSGLMDRLPWSEIVDDAHRK